MSATSNVITHLGRGILKPDIPTDFFGVAVVFPPIVRQSGFFGLTANKQEQGQGNSGIRWRIAK